MKTWEEAIATANFWLDNLKDHNTGPVMWGYVSHSESGYKRNLPCFQGLTEKEAIVLFAKVTYDPRYLEREYLTWLLSDSFCSSSFLTKNWEDVRDLGFILDRARYSTTLNAAQAVRYLADNYNIVEMWSEFSKHMGKGYAFWLAHYAMKLSDEFFIHSQSLLNNHTVVSPKDRPMPFPEDTAHTIQMEDIGGVLRDIVVYRFDELPKWKRFGV